jgi:hypothetical protein
MGLADNFLAVEGAVDLGGVDVGDPEVQRPVNGADRLGVIEPPAGGVDASHGHGSQTDAGDIKPAQRYMLHQVLLWDYHESKPRVGGRSPGSCTLPVCSGNTR